MLSKYDLIGVGVMLSPNPAGQVRFGQIHASPKSLLLLLSLLLFVVVVVVSCWWWCCCFCCRVLPCAPGRASDTARAWRGTRAALPGRG